MRAAAAVITLATLSAACGGPGGACPADLPETCGVAPSWQAEVAPIVSRACAPCHGPGGVEAARPLATYDDVYAGRRAVLDQVYSCLMPQQGSGVALTSGEQLALLHWLVCDAPDN
jgi:hypothetical protein